ncbi:hypothetical protein OROMI_004108 [Orobanche minor]
MNPLTLVKRIQDINKREANLGLSEEASWHVKYKDSAYVFVGGIPFDLTEGDLLAVFSQYGEVVDVNLVRDKATGKSKGFAFLAYEDQRSTILAVDNLNGAEILGRVIRVDHVAKYKKLEEEDEETKQQKREERGVCRAFQKGECNRGDSCKFSHDEQMFSDNSDREAERITFDGKVVHGSTFFRYLGSIIQKDGELDGDVAHRIKAGWLKWKSATGVLCDPDMPHRLKGKFYRTAIRPALLYGTECWAVKQCHVQKMNVAEMRMLRWMCGHTKKDRLRNEVIREKVRVASIEDKMMENRLRWFGHVRRRPVDAPVRRLESWGTSNIVKGRGRPKKTWIKLIENDMRFRGIRESMAMERQIWRERIRVVDEI